MGGRVGGAWRTRPFAPQGKFCQGMGTIGYRYAWPAHEVLYVLWPGSAEGMV